MKIAYVIGPLDGSNGAITEEATWNACTGRKFVNVSFTPKEWSDLESLEENAAMIVEAWNYGQFAEDFNHPLVQPVRSRLRNVCSILWGFKK